VIIGAAGMDYHVFNRIYRDNPAFDVKAFTMAVEQNLGTGMLFQLNNLAFISFNTSTPHSTHLTGHPQRLTR
jgi:hypothetical protein